MKSANKPYHHGNLSAAILQRAAEIIDADGIEHLTLRGIARDLNVSHAAPNRHFKNKAALLSALAAEAWQQVTDATLSEAAAVEDANAHIRLNAMGRGFLRWALNNRSLFRAVIHPDVNRYATDELVEATQRFSIKVREAVKQTQLEGRHPDVPILILNIYTNAVPLGSALLIIDSLLSREHTFEMDQDALIEQIINLVVPI